MAKVRAKFTGARPLKDGSLTGMLIFENISNADRHALIDLEGDVYITNENNHTEDDNMLIQKQLLYYFEKISEVVNHLIPERQGVSGT